MLLAGWREYRECIQFLNTLGNEVRGMRYDLHTAELLLPRVCPRLCHPAILVAGTNGKGSVAWWISKVFQNAGYGVALYTSPHLDNVRERIKINNQNISEESFLRNANAALRTVTEMEDRLNRLPTFYEWVTLIAAGCFQEAAADVHILEVGMGGRLDAVNVFDPILSIITTVDLDHQAVLGHSLEAIAREKMGILRKQTPAILGPQDKWSSGLEEKLAASAARIIRTRGIYQSEARHPQRPNQEENSLKTGLAGDFQLYNAATVMGACRELRKMGWNLNEESIRKGLSAGGWPGRFETISHKPEIIVDGAHNRQAMAEIVKEFRKRRQEPVVVFGAMKDKDLDGMMEELLPAARCVILTRAPDSRSAGLDDYRRLLPSHRLEYEADIMRAIHKAVDRAGGDVPVAVLGSIYLAAETRRILKKEALV